MDNESLKNLLEKVAIINQKYEEMAKISGENFNVFSILNLTTNEVRTHSAFIAELLNPKGKHGLENAFLKEFVEILKQKFQQTSKKGSPAKFEFAAEEGTKVAVEYWLGYKTETDGGYIDILLTDNSNKHIIIENKIYAGDQDKQLLRYYAFDTQAPLIYLTLDGKQPSESSTGKDEKVLKNIVCISYREHICEWLEVCLKHAVEHPRVRETIKQYLNLIKIITNQTPNDIMNTEIAKLLASKPENVTSAYLTLSAFSEMKKNLVENLVESIKVFALQNNLEIKNNSFDTGRLHRMDNGTMEDGAYLYLSFKDEPQFPSISIGFDKPDFNEFFLGVCYQEPYDASDIMKTDIGGKLKSELPKILQQIVGKDKGWPNWVYLHYFEDNFKNWGKDVFIGIASKETDNRILTYLDLTIKALKKLKD